MIRSALFLLLATSFTLRSLAQEVKHTRKITHEVTEKYTTVIGADREIKQGIYQAFYNKKIPVAIGKYKDDKKIGMWHFFNNKGQPIQNYNYDTNTLQMEAHEDSTERVSYSFDHTLTSTDIVTKPVKPGGRYYGYLPYLKCFILPKDMAGENLVMYYVTLEILVSPLGRLAQYKIHIKTKWDNNFDRVIDIYTNRLLDNDKVFMPATLNGEPISSRILIDCYFTGFDTIDIK